MTIIAHPGNLLETLAGMALILSPCLIMFAALTWPRMDRAFWTAMARNAGLFVGMLGVCLALLSAAYYWTIPVLSFIFRHEAVLATGALLAGITFMWTHCAYENYKVEVALKRPRAGHNDLWLLFHTICAGLFATALAYINTQAMAHVALLWGMGATMNIMMYI
jgi:hypothetical protein